VQLLLELIRVVFVENSSFGHPQEMYVGTVSEDRNIGYFLRLFGADFAVDRIWVWVAYWWQHNNTAIKLDKNQIWLVD
jgi:hypothetical protein